MVKKSRRSESPKHSQSLNGEELAKSVKQLVDEAIEVWKTNYDQEVDTPITCRGPHLGITADTE